MNINPLIDVQIAPITITNPVFHLVGEPDVDLVNATVRCNYCIIDTATGFQLLSGFVSLPPEKYALWTDDDSVLVGLLAEAAGYQIAVPA